MTEKEQAVLKTVIEDLMSQVSQLELKVLQDKILISTLEVTVKQLNIQVETLRSRIMYYFTLSCLGEE